MVTIKQRIKLVLDILYVLSMYQSPTADPSGTGTSGAEWCKCIKFNFEKFYKIASAKDNLKMVFRRWALALRNFAPFLLVLTKCILPGNISCNRMNLWFSFTYLTMLIKKSLFWKSISVPLVSFYRLDLLDKIFKNGPS